MSSFVKSVMKPEEFRLIREFVEKTYGLVLDSDKVSFLGSRLWKRVQELGLSTFEEYSSHIKFSPHAIEERKKFISHITNNETYFFREEPQLKAFAGSILQHLRINKMNRGNRKIRILSAGCSTGEEVYTLAMLLFEAGLFAWDWDIKIIGIDIDSQALAAAEEGIYSGRTFQSMPNHLLERYFIRYENGYRVRESLERITSFTYGNLLEIERVLNEKEFDIIFCRNVLIYFSDDTIRRVIESFRDNLTEEGVLFLGHSESLMRITDRFLPVRYPGTIIYKRNRGV